MHNKENLRENERVWAHSHTSCFPLQVPGMPPMPPMPMPPMPPGIGMLQAMNMMPGGPPPPGIHMSMEPPGLPPPGLSQDDQLKMAQQRAAMVLQQEERAKQQVRTTGVWSAWCGYLRQGYNICCCCSWNFMCTSGWCPCDGRTWSSGAAEKGEHMKRVHLTFTWLVDLLKHFYPVKRYLKLPFLVFSLHSFDFCHLFIRLQCCWSRSVSRRWLRLEGRGRWTLSPQWEVWWWWLFHTPLTHELFLFTFTDWVFPWWSPPQ